MKEIERKYLVTSNAFMTKAHKKTRLIQGYLSKDPERTVRIRIQESIAFLTIKGISNASGTTRFEWEKEIPIDEAKQLIPLCLPHLIDKVRYEVNYKHHLIEVDVFSGIHQGLVLAEIELKKENIEVSKPNWLGKEVTGDSDYYNSTLSDWSRELKKS